jgi:hypothetical protein
MRSSSGMRVLAQCTAPTPRAKSERNIDRPMALVERLIRSKLSSYLIPMIETMIPTVPIIERIRKKAT